MFLLRGRPIAGALSLGCLELAFCCKDRYDVHFVMLFLPVLRVHSSRRVWLPMREGTPWRPGTDPITEVATTRPGGVPGCGSGSTCEPVGIPFHVPGP